MPLAIITSDAHSRHSILLVLNISGVCACICTQILLVLTALKVIFLEPDISPVMQKYVTNFYNQTYTPYLHSRRFSDLPYPQTEDTYLFYLV